MIDILRFNILQRYIFRQFISSFLLCLLVACVLFSVFDFFERVNTFIKEDSSFGQVLSYLFLKLPLIIHFMTPIAVLIGTLLSVGRLSQLSEVTAMRACGASVFSLSVPVLYAGVVIWGFSALAAETIVPWGTQRVEEIYYVDIKKKVETGAYNRANFWHRSSNKFYNIGIFDTRIGALQGLSLYELDKEFQLIRRLDAEQAVWEGSDIGWSMRNVVETQIGDDGATRNSRYNRLPLVIVEKPQDFYDYQKMPETMSYRELNQYIHKLTSEGVPVTKYVVALASKISFPFVNIIVILVGFPFALSSARSGTMTLSFIAGVSTGFGYHFIHAVSTSLGAAELIPIYPAAWAANIFFLCIGGYLLAGAEYR